MKSREILSIINRYSERLKRFGDDPLTLGWTKGKHYLRYHILLSEWEYKKDSLLDFGCGFGDLYGYIRENKLKINYHGIDINKKLIQVARSKYEKCDFKCGNIFSINFRKKYDYVVSSGVHNLKLKDNYAFIEDTFLKFSTLAKKGFAINFISDKVDFKEEHLFHSNPMKILKLAYHYSNRVILRNDYMPFEFTIFVFLNDEFDKKTVVYPEFRNHLLK